MYTSSMFNKSTSFNKNISRFFQSNKRNIITNNNIKEAVNLWIDQKEKCLYKFGHISNWDVSNVTNMNELFYREYNFNEDISRWNVSNVTNMSYMFSEATSFNQDISQWNVSNVTDMSYMFNGATSFNQDISQWNVSNVIDMRHMFYKATSFNCNISSWNVSNVTDMNYMFSEASKFNQDISQWNVSKVKHSIIDLYQRNLNITSSSIAPTLGIKLNHLEKFILNCGGREILENKTTTEVRDQFINPITLWSENSYCGMIKQLRDENEREDVGEANVFISHAWSYKFLELVDFLFKYFNEDKKKNEIIIWLDIFSINQHQTINNFKYWSETFKSAIHKFGRTVMVLSHWNDPVPLTRTWCLWELYCTVVTGCKLEIAMTNESKQQLIQDIVNHPEFEIRKIFDNIDIEQSQCLIKKDKKRIFNVVKKTSGFSNLKAIISKRLRECFMDIIVGKCAKIKLKLCLQYHDSEINNQNKYLKEQFIKLSNYQSKLGFEYSANGKHEESLESFKDCLALKRALLSDKDPETLKSMKDLANIYLKLQKFNEYYEIHQDICTIERNSW